MSVSVKINVKGSSAKIEQTDYEYPFIPGEPVSAGEFLDETVKLTLSQYEKLMKDNGTADIFRVLSKTETDRMAESGKITFGIKYSTDAAFCARAVHNARQCFLDSLIAMFIDGNRYEQLEDIFVLNNNSEVTFVRLSFLSGRLF